MLIQVAASPAYNFFCVLDGGTVASVYSLPPLEFVMQNMPLPLTIVLSGLYYNFSKFNGFAFCILSNYAITSIPSFIKVCKIP